MKVAQPYDLRDRTVPQSYTVRDSVRKRRTDTKLDATVWEKCEGLRGSPRCGPQKHELSSAAASFRYGRKSGV